MAAMQSCSEARRGGPGGEGADPLVRTELQERVKELTCLYGIAQLAIRADLPTAELLRGILELLPPAWQYPEVTGARLELGELTGSAGLPGPFVARQSAAVAVRGRQRGMVEVGYCREMPASDEGPFLREERSLLDAVARQIGLILGRREAEQEKERLQEQLRHAERLATIGQLAAGVAHELNEPLGSVLGFAQLAARQAGLPGQVREDLERIVAASLHAREVIRKLMTFARQTPPTKALVQLDGLVQDGLTFLESRCSTAGIELVRRVEPGTPPVAADPAQLSQVLINLVVNAVQAMPSGGRLSVETFPRDGRAVLAVEDTGVGMTKEVREKCFLPFFTTKEHAQGTGLGLAVVHGIVEGHGGSIAVRSSPGKGSRFEVELPAAGSEEAGK